MYAVYITLKLETWLLATFVFSIANTLFLDVFYDDFEGGVFSSIPPSPPVFCQECQLHLTNQSFPNTYSSWLKCEYR